jgi:hypothetical protein
MAFLDRPDVKLLGMWSWHAKAQQIAVFGISNSTFLIGYWERNGTASPRWLAQKRMIHS